MKLITLDEPTTNLDRETIGSLAMSLHKIINDRKGQRNFQLIIITHDEEFLKKMRCQDFTDVYFRVSRNANQKSEIEGMSISFVSLSSSCLPWVETIGHNSETHKRLLNFMLTSFLEQSIGQIMG